MKFVKFMTSSGGTEVWVNAALVRSVRGGPSGSQIVFERSEDRKDTVSVAASAEEVVRALEAAAG